MSSPLYTDLRNRSRSSGRGRDGGLRLSSTWEEALTIAISGVRVVLDGLPASLELALRHRFGLFVVPNERGADTDLVVRVRPAVVKNYLDFDRQVGSKLYTLETRVHAQRLHAWSYAFAGWFDIHGSEGEICLCESAIEPPERSIENFLRVAFAWKAASRGGFLLHASGLVRDGLAYLFFGPSGSGKTTVTRLSTTELLLNDDCIHVTRQGETFMAQGVPFKGRDDCGAERAEPFPIAGLFRLVQSRRVFCQKLSTAQAVGEIASSIPFVSERPEGLDGTLSVIEDLVRSVPVSRLHFRLAPDFWNAIEESLRG